MNFPETNESSVLKNIVKLKAGESITGVFRGEIHTFRQHWDGTRSYPCSGLGCAFCADKNKALFRFQLNFVTKENGVLVAKVFQQGYKTMLALKEFNKEFPLEKNWVKITRAGNGTDTTYTVMPIKNSELTAAAEREVSKVQLNTLNPDAVAGAKDAKAATDKPDEEGDEAPL